MATSRNKIINTLKITLVLFLLVLSPCYAEDRLEDGGARFYEGHIHFTTGCDICINTKRIEKLEVEHEYPQYYKFKNNLIRIDKLGIDGKHKVTIEK